MNEQQLASYRTRLREISSRTRGDVDTVREQALGPAGGQADGALSNAPLHLGDMATETYLQELNATLLENEEYLLTEALAALRRIDDGTFGTCEECGKAIPAERLDAMPSTRHCAACAQALQPGPRGNFNTGRAQVQRTSNHGQPSGQQLASGSKSAESDGSRAVDSHAAGTAGGGTALGGLAGTNVGHGDPDDADVERATGTGDFDARDGAQDDEPQSGRAGGAVGETPAGKRTGKKNQAANSNSKGARGGHSPRRKA